MINHNSAYSLDLQSEIHSQEYMGYVIQKRAMHCAFVSMS